MYEPVIFDKEKQEWIKCPNGVKAEGCRTLSGKEPKEITDTRENFKIAKLTKYSNMILAEYRRAKELHSLWPNDIIHAVAIMAEESGEAIRAALNMQYEDANIEDVERELIQTAAMALRCLVNLEI